MNKIFSKFLPVVAALVGMCSLVSSAYAEMVPSAVAGEKKAAMCIGCHSIPGYQASFPEVHKVPMISGQSAKYIASALARYQTGERKHPTMKAIAASLSAQDMADLAAFYEAQGAALPAADKLPPPSPKVAALLEKGLCITCHGVNFSKPTGDNPKLAGQHADYLYVALRAYQINGNPQVGRGNAVMIPQVQGLSPAELKLIVQYLASLPSELQVVPQSRFR